MKLTNELWKVFGFRKDNSLGGTARWYYIKKEFRGANHTKAPGSISIGGVLSFNCGDPKNPQTVQELTQYMNEFYKDYGYNQGVANLQQEFKNLLNIE
jgi:hypothetical protein